jgi:hypothetical protein
MRVVLYADDMEPITVIELSALAEGYLNERGMVRLAVQMPAMLSVLAARQAPGLDDLRIVTIFAERFIRHGHEHMMLFTRDEESALLLKSAFLPGQQAELQERERTAFARGFLEALARVGNV